MSGIEALASEHDERRGKNHTDHDPSSQEVERADAFYLDLFTLKRAALLRAYTFFSGDESNIYLNRRLEQPQLKLVVGSYLAETGGGYGLITWCLADR
jgi:hypothetical protein